MMASAYDAYGELGEEVAEDAVATTIQALSDILAVEGDLSPYLDKQMLTRLGSQVVEDYERDCSDRADWEAIVKDALKKAAQEEKGQKNYPWTGAANVNYPIITIAATEFNARAYPAIVKGDETVQVKVVGNDTGKPELGPDGMPQVEWQIGPDGQMAVDEEGLPIPQMGPDGQPLIKWAIKPGAKAKRAARVKDYMNVVLNYRMKGWEGDMDLLLYQLPIVGCAFKKLWWDGRRSQPAECYVPALRLVVPMGAKDLETAPRYTEEMPDTYPYQLRQKMATGQYRAIDLVPTSEDAEAPRMCLEQHRLMDLDGDGLDEPYIVTVDKETSQVLRVEAAFAQADVSLDQQGGVILIERPAFYVKFDFLPHPQGKFYGIGLGHLLSELGAVIDTTINQMLDAGHAQIAGGGFMASGLRLQGNGQTNTLRFRPGEYKTVNVAGATLRDAIYERTFPGASPVMFSLLQLILGAANDVAAIKDVTSGDASNNGQVGTTLALIEQGLQVFTAIYKRVYRSLKTEFQLMYDNLGDYGTQATADDYMNVLDDPEADFASDFGGQDYDICPVSDPTNVTRIQKMAKANFVKQIASTNPNMDQNAVDRMVLEAADIPDIDKLFLPAPPPDAPPPPEAQKVLSETKRNEAQAALYAAQAAAIPVTTETKAAESAAKVENTQADTMAKGIDTGIRLGEAENGPETSANK